MFSQNVHCSTIKKEIAAGSCACANSLFKGDGDYCVIPHGIFRYAIMAQESISLREFSQLSPRREVSGVFTTKSGYSQ